MILNRPPNYRTYLAEISDGIAGVKQTLRLMSSLVKTYKRLPQIRNFAVRQTCTLDDKDYVGEVDTLFRYVRDCIRYVQDIDDTETIQTPDVTIDMGAGDCDDKSTLLAALLSSIGHPVRFKAVGFSPGTLDHVYVETKIGERWVALDATEPHDMGWAPPNPVEKYVEHI